MSIHLFQPNAFLGTDSLQKLESTLCSVSGHQLQLWQSFIQPLSKGWLLRDKKPVPKSSVRIRFWVKKMSCLGDKNSRREVAAIIDLFDSSQLDGADSPLLQYQLFLDQDQKKALKQWWGLQKKVRGRCAEWVESHAEKPTFQTLYDCAPLYGRHPLKAELIREFLAKSGNSQERKDPQDSEGARALFVPQSLWPAGDPFLRTVFAAQQLLPTQLEANALLHYEENSWLETRHSSPGALDKSASASPFVFICPATDSFVTCLGSDGIITSIGGELLEELDRLSSELAALDNQDVPWLPKRQLRKLKADRQKLEPEVQKLTCKTHTKVAKYLCEHYDHVLVCDSLTAFAERLTEVTKMYRVPTRVTLVEYTHSDTCSSCGGIGRKEKGVFLCKCGLSCGQDENNVKMVLIKYLLPRVGEVLSEVLDEYK